MREYSIITEPLTFLAILEIQIREEINEHGYMCITGYIPDDVEEEYLYQSMTELWEKVELVGKDGEKAVLFWGLVTDFILDQNNDQKKLTLIIRSGSWMLDEKEHFRSWQSGSVTYKEIFEDVCSAYSRQGIIFNRSLEEKTGELILQYQETDWSFLKRMASRQNRFLVAESGIPGCKLFYDMPMRKEIAFTGEGKYSLKKELGEYRKKRQNGLGWLIEEDCLVYELESRERHRIGECLMLRGRRLYLYKMEGRYEGGEMRYRYQLKYDAGLSIPCIHQEKCIGCCLEARIKAVKEDKVQVVLSGDENREQEINLWYPYATVYSTPDGTGWYCMPEIGDEVRLTIPGREEREAYVISSVHLGTDSEDRKNPEEKVFKTKYQKEIRFTPDSIMITNNQGNWIKLQDQEGIQIVSSGILSLEASEDITISSDNGSLIAAGTTEVKLKQKGTSIKLDEGISFIGGELKVQ